jgi:sialidase-1
MEGIVRHLRKSNSEIDIVMMHFVDPDKIASYNIGVEPNVIVNHNKVAKHYNIQTINLAKEVTDRINNNEFTWKDDFKNLHPSPFGQGIYANSIVQFLNNAYSIYIDADNKILSHNLPDKIDDYSYDNGYLIDISAAKFNKNWSIDSFWNPKDGTNTRKSNQSQILSSIRKQNNFYYEVIR